MDTTQKAQQQYDQMVKKASPNSPIWTNCLKAFFSGGLICTIGQLLLEFYKNQDFKETEAALLVSITLIGLSALLTALGLYEKLGKFCGAGTIVPITGFANSVVSPAIEFKKDEGVIIGAKQNIADGCVFLARKYITKDIFGCASTLIWNLMHPLLKGRRGAMIGYRTGMMTPWLNRG